MIIEFKLNVNFEVQLSNFVLSLNVVCCMKLYKFNHLNFCFRIFVFKNIAILIDSTTLNYSIKLEVSMRINVNCIYLTST